MSTPLYTYQKRSNIKDPVDRFFSHIEVLENECWNWTGRLEPTGYSRFSVRERRMGGHVFSHETFIGPIPSGNQVDHLCRNPSCVNPSHLEAVTALENTRRSTVGLAATARHAANRKNVCKDGHSLLDPGNVYHRDRRKGWNGVRCKTCQANYLKNYRKESK